MSGCHKRSQLIGYLWFRFGQYEEDEVRCTYQLTPPEHSVFDFDLYLFPEHRMGLGFAAVWHGASGFLRERGVLYSFSRITRFNLLSRRAHSHLGCKRVGSAFFLQIGVVEVMAGTLSPYVHVLFRSSDRVRLKLAPDVLRR
jgi:hypothetical protein